MTANMLEFLSRSKTVEKMVLRLTVKILMAHEVGSLNVAAASAVAFWELGHR